MERIVSYDSENDILAIHKGFSSDERFKGNIDVGELILDVSTKKRIRGIEIINASEYFREFDITKTALKGMTNANFNATIKPNSISIAILIKTKNQELPAKIAVPLHSQASGN